MLVSEPMTVLTDYGLAAVGGGLGAVLWRRAQAQRSRQLWAAAFIAVAAAALVGGTSHGLGPRLDEASRTTVWRATYVLVGMGNLLILAGAAVAAARASLRGWLLAAVVLRFGVFAAFIALRPDFRYVVYDYAVTLAGLLLFAAHLRRRTSPAARWILGGVAVSLAGAAVQRSGLGLGPAFNHNDVFHVVQAAGLWLYSRGGSRLQDG